LTRENVKTFYQDQEQNQDFFSKTKIWSSIPRLWISSPRPPFLSSRSLETKTESL